MSDHAVAHSDSAGHADHGEHGITKYLYVFGALCVLTTMSFLTYSDFWPESLSDPHVKWLFMMAVSCCKAMLVVLFFMHVKYEANWKYVLTIPASIMAVFLALALIPDVGRRFHDGLYKPTAERLEHVGSPAEAEEIQKLSRDIADGHEKHEGGHGGSKEAHGGKEAH
jgi:cytochrome c oxidase subunit 4